jgi:hypothetical protein
VPPSAHHLTPPSSKRVPVPGVSVLALAAQPTVGPLGAPPFRSLLSVVEGFAPSVLPAARHLIACDPLAPAARPAAEPKSVLGALSPARHLTAGVPLPATAAPAAGSRLVPRVPGVLPALSPALPLIAGAPAPAALSPNQRRPLVLPEEGALVSTPERTFCKIKGIPREAWARARLW